MPTMQMGRTMARNRCTTVPTGLVFELFVSVHGFHPHYPHCRSDRIPPPLHIDNKCPAAAERAENAEIVADWFCANILYMHAGMR